MASVGAWEPLGAVRFGNHSGSGPPGGEKWISHIQKAVELGVAAIVPVESRRSVTRLSAGDRAGRRVAHWQGVAASACEQCGRNQVPTVGSVERLENWLARPRKGAATHAGTGARWRCRSCLSPAGCSCW